MTKFARFSLEEINIVSSIASRAIKAGIYPDGCKMDVKLDLSAVHLHCPLRLADLLAADEFDFAYDMIGILLRLNRRTGKLEHSFLPRFTQSKG